MQERGLRSYGSLTTLRFRAPSSEFGLLVVIDLNNAYTTVSVFHPIVHFSGVAEFGVYVYDTQPNEPWHRKIEDWGAAIVTHLNAIRPADLNALHIPPKAKLKPPFSRVRVGSTDIFLAPREILDDLEI